MSQKRIYNDDHVGRQRDEFYATKLKDNASVSPSGVFGRKRVVSRKCALGKVKTLLLKKQLKNTCYGRWRSTDSHHRRGDRDTIVHKDIA